MKDRERFGIENTKRLNKWIEANRRHQLKKRISGIISYAYLGDDKGSLLSDDVAERIMKEIEDMVVLEK